MDSLKPEDKLTHKCNIFNFTTWHKQAEAWVLSSNFSVSNPSIQKQFFRSIINPVVMNAIESHIKVITTFTEMLKLAKEYFNKTTSGFDSIQQWLNLRQDK